MRKLVRKARSWNRALMGRWNTGRNLSANRGRASRRLEIGPGDQRIEGFETLNIVTTPSTDYVCDATGKLPFEDATFELIYASHILEHVPWYQTRDVLQEWVRILKPGGVLEIWVPDGLKIARAFVEAEDQGGTQWREDGWFKFNEQRDACVWASGRFFTYGDGTGRSDDPNWHRAVFSERYLRSVMESAGLRDVRRMDRGEVRGHDHAWINLGMKGVRG